MRKILLVIPLFIFQMVFAQDNLDKIYFHSGAIIDADVKKIDETTILYSYPNEVVEIVISKMCIDKIVYRSGREEDVSEKIEVSGEDDWEKVQILYNPSEIVGLKKVEDIQAKTKGFFSGYTSAAGSDRRANEKLLREAAKLNCEFILLLVDKDAKGGMQRGSYGNQSLKKGTAYTYH